MTVKPSILWKIAWAVRQKWGSKEAKVAFIDIRKNKRYTVEKVKVIQKIKKLKKYSWEVKFNTIKKYSLESKKVMNSRKIKKIHLIKWN